MKVIQLLKILFTLITLLCVMDSIRSQVTVNATSGTATANYSNLYNAFNAINNGVHQGNITILITASFVESGSSSAATIRPLRASGIGAANYSQITIRPVGNVTVTSGARTSQRGIYEFYGTDNVIIDGDDPNTPGQRNLTFSSATNTSLSLANFRICNIGSDIIDNFTIKNCIFFGSRNSLVSNTILDCIITLNDSASTAITGFANGISNLTIENNEFLRSNIALLARNSGTPQGNNWTIKDNIIGSSNSTNAITNIGIWLNGSDNIVVEKNDIRVGFANNTNVVYPTYGIYLWDDVPNILISKNYIHDVFNYGNVATETAGIGLWTDINTSGIKMYNNIIKDVLTRRVVGTRNPAIGAPFGIMVRGSSAPDMEIINNTIALNQVSTQSVTPAVTNPSAYAVGFFQSSGAEIKSFFNNIIVNNNPGPNSFGIFIDDFQISTSATFDRNSYYTPSGNTSIGLVNSLNNTLITKLEDWQMYSGLDTNSFWFKPNFVNDLNDLHITPSVVSKLNNAGLPNLTVAQDYDNEFRSQLTPDIGADEFSGITYVAPIINSVSISPIVNPCVAESRTVTANISEGNAFLSAHLFYSQNFGTEQNIQMSSTTSGIYTATLPIPTPANARVSYRVRVISSQNDTLWSSASDYNFNAVSGARLPRLLPEFDSLCSGSTAKYKLKYDETSTIFSAPSALVLDTVGSDITLVEISSGAQPILSNSSTYNSLTGTYGTATGTAGISSNFSALRVDTFNIAIPYNVTLASQSNVNFVNRFRILVDLNGDGLFTANEILYVSPVTVPKGGRIETGTLSIPKNALPGLTRMRVQNFSSVDNVLYALFGETEDYSIYIKPHYTLWRLDNNLTTNDKDTLSFVTTSPSNIVGVRLRDSSGCIIDVDLDTMMAPISNTKVTMTSNLFAGSCIYDTILFTTSTIGGCPPYRYKWYQNSVLMDTTPTFKYIHEAIDNIKVVVTDKNNQSDSSNINTISPLNPQLANTIWDDTSFLVCERGSVNMRLRAATVYSDTVFWYNSFSSHPLTGTQSRVYTTPVVSDTTFFYYRLRRNVYTTPTLLGRTTKGTSIDNNPAFANTGLIFNARKDILLESCQIFYTSAGGEIQLALTNKAGLILDTTAIITLPASNTSTPVTIPIGIRVPMGNEYRLIVYAIRGVTELSYSANSVVTNYPLNITTPFNITSGLFQGNSTSQYFYFYNFRVIQSECFGTPNPMRVDVLKNRKPTVIQDLRSMTVCEGSSATLSVNVQSLTLNGRFSLDWYRNGVNLKVNDKTGTHTISNFKSSDQGLYNVRVKVNDSFCMIDTVLKDVTLSLKTKITYDNSKLIPTQNLCENSKLFVDLKPQGVDSIVWFFGTNRVDSPIARFDTLEIDSVKKSNQGTYYAWLRDINGCKDSIIPAFSLIVHDQPSITTHPRDTSVCLGAPFALRARASNYTTLEWYKNGALILGLNIDSIIRTRSRITDTGLYYLAAKSYPGCKPAYTDIVSVRISPAPQLGYSPASLAVCEGNTLRLQSNYINGDTVKWFRGTSLIAVNIDTLVIPNVNSSIGGTYRYSVSGNYNCNEATSSPINVSVALKPVIESLDTSAIIVCSDSIVRRTANVSNVSNMYWTKNGLAIMGQRSASLALSGLSAVDNGRYALVASSSPICPDTVSASFSVTVSQKVSLTQHPVGGTFCNGNKLTMTAQADGATTYQWLKDGAPIANATSSSFTINSLTSLNNGIYSVRISNPSPCTPFTFSDTTLVKVIDNSASVWLPTYSVYSAVEQCTDAGTQWTYYANPANTSQIMFAIRKNGNNINPKIDVIVRDQIFHTNINNDKTFEGSIIGKRIWNLDLKGQPIVNPIQVKHYIDPNDVNDIKNLQLRLATEYQNVKFKPFNEPSWIRTDNIPFTSQLLSAISGQNLNFDYNLVNELDINAGKENNIDYLVFNDIYGSTGGALWVSYKGDPMFESRIINSSNDRFASLWPNPTTDGKLKLSIQMAIFGDIQMTVFNSLGQNVFNTPLMHQSNQTIHPFDFGDLPSGHYYMQLQHREGSQSIKFVIQK